MDARFGAASVHEALTRRFGPDQVFLDSASIPVGAKYPEEIFAALGQVSVLVVCIGPEWMAADERGRLIDREDDWVRREIRHAVKRKIVIVPVLLDGASLPSEHELPEDIRDLTRRQCLEVGHRNLAADLARLGDCVARSVPGQLGRGPTSRHELRLRATRTRWGTVGGLVVVVLVLATALSTLAGDSAGRPGRSVDRADSLIGDPRTADPCTLIKAVTFARFGRTRLDPAYGNFNRCDVVVSPEDGEPIDVEVQFDDGPLDENAEPAEWVGAIGIVLQPVESEACIRGLTLPSGDGGRVVMVSADVPKGTGTAEWCELADVAAATAAQLLDEWHSDGKAIPRRSFSAESIAHQDACLLPDGDALTAAIPGVDATKPDPGFGHWKCGWSSTNGETSADVRFDQTAPLDASNGRPTRIDNRKAFLEPNGDGAGTCVVKVVYRTHVGLYGRKVDEVLQVTIADGGNLSACRSATTLATSAAAALPR